MKRDRVEWLCLITALFAITAVFFLAQHSALKRNAEAERARLDLLGSVLAAQVGTNIRSVDQALRGVLRDHVAPSAQPDALAVNRRLQALQQAMPQVRGFTLIDADGKVTAATPQDLIGRNFGERLYFTTVRDHPSADLVYVSAPFHSVRGDVVISITRMIPGKAGEFDGIVSAVLDPAYFSTLLATVLYAPDVSAFVVHGEGAQLLQVPAGRARAAGPVLLHAVTPAGMAMNQTLSIGISRDASAIAAPLQRQYLLFGAILGALQLAAVCLLRWSQRARGRAGLRTAQELRERLRGDAVRQSEARFRTLIEEAPVAVAIVRGGKFIYTNRRYNLLHGYDDDADLQGHQWSAMIAPASLCKLHAQEAAIGADAPEEQRFEALGLGKHASLVPVLKATARVDLIDGPATLIFVQDIAAQKRAEASLLDARDAAQAASQSKADFLANMSHEIRTPLNAILGLAYLLEHSGPGPDAQAMLVKIRVAGKSLLGIINDILDVSKIEAGQMTIETAWFDLQQVLDNVAATMGVAVANKDIDLLVHPLPAGMSSVLGDPLRLEQILSNLASNAIKFTQRGRVELAVTALSCQGDHALLRFAIRDTGIGIAPHLQSAVFAPFTQADSSTTRRFGGSGLGLAICTKLVGLLGGTIGLDSEAGAGSEFWFTLPVQYASAVSSPEMAGLHLLIAHDNPAALAIIAGTARGLGWRVSTTASSVQAIDFVQGAAPGQRPDVVVLNRSSADPASVAAAAAIRACVPACTCPVLIMTTTYDLGALAEPGDASAVDAFLTKPITASTLYNAVIEACRKRGATVSCAPTVVQHGHTSLAGIRLLVVDDSEINRDVAQRIFSGEGAEVMLANDGRDAIDWLQAHPDAVDLVLMDVQMPILDGIEACRILRTMPAFADLPIVALTAGAFQTQHDAARAAGMSDFIAKPFDIPLTLALIRRLHRPPGRSAAAAAGPAAGPAAAPAAAPVVIDSSRGVALWGDAATYRAYLSKFAISYDSAAPILRTAPQAEAAAMAHQLAGAAGNVALPAVAAAALALERALNCALAREAPLAVLERAMADARVHIALPVPAGETSPHTGAAAEPAADSGALLDALMAALYADNPAPAAAPLQQLAQALGTQPVAAIASALSDFDFRAAEAATRALATVLQHRLKEVS